MNNAKGAEGAYDRACSGILRARACLMQFAAPLPALEVTIPDEQWEIVCKADAVAGEAERLMREATEIIRTGLLGWPSAGPLGGSGEEV